MNRALLSILICLFTYISVYGQVLAPADTTYGKAQLDTIDSREILLKPCLEVCVIFCGDISGSMGTAMREQVLLWAIELLNIPVESGYIEFGLYSFTGDAQCWVKPTGDKVKAMMAVNEFVQSGITGGTVLTTVLDSIHNDLVLTRPDHPFRYEVLIISSDWYLDDYESAKKVIETLANEGVIVLFATPLTDSSVTSSKDVNLPITTLLSTYGIVVWNSFKAVREILGYIEPKRTCN